MIKNKQISVALEALFSGASAGNIKYVPLKDVIERPDNIRWSTVGSETFTYIDLSSVRKIPSEINSNTIISANNPPSRARQLVKQGDVIFATTRPTQAHGAVVPVEYDNQIASTGFCVLRPKKSLVCANYLSHLLGTSRFKKYVEANQSAGNYPAISDRLIYAYKIPLPSLELQAVLGSLLDQLTELEAELKAELEAELEARQKQYQYYLTEMMSETRADIVRLGEVASFDYGYTAKAADSGSHRFIRITDIDDDGRLRKHNHKFIDLPDDAKQYVVNKGDLLMARTGATFGKTMLADAKEPSAFASFLIRIKLDSNRLLPKFYWHFAQSELFWSQANSLVARAGQPQFNANRLRLVQVPVPPIAKQHEIIDILNKFNALTTDLTSGLPAEIAARRKQYEYYRDKLLTFEEQTE